MPPLDAPSPLRLDQSELAAYWLPFIANWARLAGLARRVYARLRLFDEDLVIRAVGDTIVLAPALIASEDDIAAIVDKLALILRRLR